MASFAEVIEVAASPPEAFAYVADFTTAAEWDPGILASRKLTDAPDGLGARYDVQAEFRGKTVPFTYEVVDFDAGRRIVLHGEGEKATSDDTITFEETSTGGTRIRYEATLALKGILRLAEPFLGGTFETIGRKALAGLKDQLDARKPA